jgi:hypothetical protein
MLQMYGHIVSAKMFVHTPDLLKKNVIESSGPLQHNYIASFRSLWALEVILFLFSGCAGCVSSQNDFGNVSDITYF